MVVNPSSAGLFVILTLLGSCTILAKISPLSTRQYLSLIYSDTALCRTVPGLTKSQIELCYQQPDTTDVALQGLNLAARECQHQFQAHRWNCSSLATRAQNPYTSAIFQRGYKETAFAYAIASAGVVISVARSCSAGKLMNCGCDGNKYKVKGRKPRGVPTTSWKWGGCSHNIHFGIKFSRKFLDSREKAEDIQANINLHNNQVGRMAVSNNMQIKCKCHGLSGSCQLKTCWRATPDFRTVGRMLKERFRSAILVEQSNLSDRTFRKFNIINQKKRRQEARLKQSPRKNKRKRDLSYDLLYYQKSPNFCEKDKSIDVPGTSGRFCNRTGTGSDACSTLCCGRGYNLIKQRRVERCNCKFHWCCHVECQSCVVEEWISVCK